MDSFKNKLDKKNITNKFSFNLLNKFIYDNNFENISDVKKTNEDIFYDLLYKKLINIIHEEKKTEKGKDIIESFISLRNCFIFLEYLYLLIQQYPEKINHYIIKIDISLLLDIPQKISKRLINSDEFFYLNLIELKGLFPKIEYTPSEFINRFENSLYNKYNIYIEELKSKKLMTLEDELSNLVSILSQFNDIKSSYLNDYLFRKKKNLSDDLKKRHKNYDELIEKYISATKDCENKKLEQIINEIDEQEGIIPSFNYLYLIALNIYKQIQNTKKDENNNEILNEENSSGVNENKIDEGEKLINLKDKFENIIKKNTIKVDEKVKYELQNKKEIIIKNEELRAEFNDVIPEKNLSELKIEEIKKDKDIYVENIKKNFTYDKVLNFEESDIYNFLFVLEINRKIIKENIGDIGNLDYKYIEFKNKFISSINNLNSVNYNYFYDLISDKSFHDEIIDILKSQPIKDYLNGYRYFEEIKEDDKNKNTKECEFKFVKKGEVYTENFTEEYNKLIKYLENDIFYINLFRLKYLPFGIKAFVNYTLKIFINSLYYEFNKNIDENNKKIIFKAALKILIIHEIMHILKFLKKNVNFNEMPQTPRKREAGKMLINYLFGRPTIKSINLEEAEKINDLNTWNDINLLRNIFPTEKEILEKKESYNKKIDHIDLYFTEEDIDEENYKKEEEVQDIGIDID